jgi:tRNA(Ile)-lysidine synthase
VNVTCQLRSAVRSCLAALPAEAVGVVALSGGPDSVALLRAMLLEVTAPVVVAHVNHQLRGEESDADEAFVRALHQDLAASDARLLPLWCQRLEVRAAAGGDNLESVARRLRYDWLAAVASATGAVWVATGHTADDQAETVLHRLLRGTGLGGLAGIPRCRELSPGCLLVRPLLDVRRQDVLDFLQRLGQPFCRDSSNSDLRFTRNRLRHELLPLLTAQFNPATVDVLCRLAEQAGQAQVYIAVQAKQLLEAAELPRAGATIVLNRQVLSAAVPLLVCEALKLIWERERWPLGEMGFEDWQRVLLVVMGTQPALDLPGGVRVKRAGQVLQVRS